MSLLGFLCNEVLSVIRLRVLNTGSNTTARKRIVDRLAIKFYGNLLSHPKPCGSNMDEPQEMSRFIELAPLNYACAAIGVGGVHKRS